MEDSRKAQLRLITAKERSAVLSSEMLSLEARIAALTTELGNKKSVLAAARQEVEEMNERINYNLDKKNGLCIRYGINITICLRPFQEVRS
jgi:predicted  nucleic acid-binding Zn-ribbon protein